jgi:predicted oxidoreductase
MERLLQAKSAAAIRLGREDWYRLLQASKGEEVA